jgi:hypothetical protein
MAKKKGSALLMVLIALVVSSLIGGAIISYSLSNYKLRNQVGNSYEDRYIAEGGIDQSYGVLMKLASEADDQDDLESKINDEFSTSSDYEYFYDLYDGDLKLNAEVEVEDNVIEIVVDSIYNNEEVIGTFNITYSNEEFSIALTDKTFK